MAYKSKLERFDMERGDVLSVEREMAKGITKLGEQIAGPILFRLYTWFAGEPGDAPPEMADPRDNVFLAMLMEHQRKNAARRSQPSPPPCSTSVQSRRLAQFVSAYCSAGVRNAVDVTVAVRSQRSARSAARRRRSSSIALTSR